MDVIMEAMMKLPRQAYTAEFKQLAVNRVRSGRSIPAVARELGLIEPPLHNGVKAAVAGMFTGTVHGDAAH